MNKKYDIFISYRRNGGDMVSARLYDSLREKKYRVFHTRMPVKIQGLFPLRFLA